MKDKEEGISLHGSHNLYFTTVEVKKDKNRINITTTGNTDWKLPGEAELSLNMTREEFKKFSKLVNDFAEKF